MSRSTWWMNMLVILNSTLPRCSRTPSACKIWLGHWICGRVHFSSFLDADKDNDNGCLFYEKWYKEWRTTPRSQISTGGRVFPVFSKKIRRRALRKGSFVFSWTAENGTGFRKDNDGTKLVKKMTKEIHQVHQTLRKGSLRLGWMCWRSPHCALLGSPKLGT